jgi:hypothetical protein
MGLSLEFYAGNAEAIGTAVSEVEFDGIRDGTGALAYADFSLHLAPGDLDVLSGVAAEQVGIEPLLLSRCLVGEVGTIDDGAGGGADVVDPAWVEMVAALDEADSGEVTARWIGALAEVYGEDLAVTEAAVRAVGSLIRLCKAARSGRAQVVHVWYL